MGMLSRRGYMPRQRPDELRTGAATLKALCRHGKKDVRYETVPDPGIEDPRDAIVKISSCAICGSDLQLFGDFMPGMQSGDILGHEFMGASISTRASARLPAC